MKIIRIFIILLLLISNFTIISYAEIEKYNDFLDTKQECQNIKRAPIITSVKYLSSKKTFFGNYECSFKVSAYDPDGDDIHIYYRQTNTDIWRNKVGFYPSPVIWSLSWKANIGVHTAYFYVEDKDGLESATFAQSYNVPKPKVKISTFILFEELLNLPLLHKLLKL